MVTYNTKQFTLTGKIFVAELSDFKTPWGGELDLRINLVSDKTGQAAIFTPAGTDTRRDADGDITHWVFTPTISALEAHPQLQGYEIHILND